MARFSSNPIVVTPFCYVHLPHTLFIYSSRDRRVLDASLQDVSMRIHLNYFHPEEGCRWVRRRASKAGSSGGVRRTVIVFKADKSTLVKAWLGFACR
ncbi:hypothetical protein D9758_006265 [Tetrapyrgos nigripes]|uniref:Uncharacterized protein n=1 Tax=Tetrapyrgos nigripes TaxID=182062 RepID=A0A8H5LLF2_9AGAR|nr:hypothetical protein D9758_006265 [Tetrapyrgos nigripes]